MEPPIIVHQIELDSCQNANALLTTIAYNEPELAGRLIEIPILSEPARLYPNPIATEKWQNEPQGRPTDLRQKLSR
jgi:hypothetical protein